MILVNQNKTNDLNQLEDLVWFLICVLRIWQIVKYSVIQGNVDYAIL